MEKVSKLGTIRLVLSKLKEHKLTSQIIHTISGTKVMTKEQNGNNCIGQRRWNDGSFFQILSSQRMKQSKLADNLKKNMMTAQDHAIRKGKYKQKC